MLRRLLLGEFVIVESSVLDLAPGLNVLTGETGAGKSILVDALGLLVGGRGSADWVRAGARRLHLEAGFDLRGLALDRQRLEDRGIRVDDDEFLLVQREISVDGRSRSFVNGSQVLIGDLRALTEDLLRIVGQGDARALISTRTLESLLDRLGASEALAREYRRCRRLFEDARAALLVAHQARAAFEREEDWLRFQLQEIREAEVEPGERERLVAARERVRDREEFEARAREVQERLAGDEGSVIDHLESLAHLLRRAESEPWSTLRARIDDLRETTRELIRGLPDPDEAPEIDVAAVEARLAKLDKLRRKYGDEESILGHAASLEEQLSNGEELGAEETRAEDAVARARQALAAVGRELSEARRRAARDLEERLQPELAGLGMPHAQVRLEFRRHASADGVAVDEGVWEPREGGLDAITAAFRSHHEIAWSDLSRAASGGELSRVLLAMQVVIGDAAPIATWIFDEIDAGVGGETAQRVAELLARLARRTQVLLVTHLPAIAARADRHFRVTKSEAVHGVRAVVEELQGEARLEELARMLAGDAHSAVARRHAEALLSGVDASAPPVPAGAASPKRRTPGGLAGGPARAKSTGSTPSPKRRLSR